MSESLSRKEKQKMGEITKLKISKQSRDEYHRMQWNKRVILHREEH
jgi:hypothetical protein